VTHTGVFYYLRLFSRFDGSSGAYPDKPSRLALRLRPQRAENEPEGCFPLVPNHRVLGSSLRFSSAPTRRECVTLLSQMGSTCSTASAAVSPEPQLRGEDVKLRAVYSSLPANTGLETGLLRGLDTAPTRRDASQRSSGRRDSLPVQFSRSAEKNPTPRRAESNPKAGLDNPIWRLSSNSETPHGRVQRKAFSGADDVIQPGTATGLRRGMAQSAPPPPQPATSKVRRASLHPTARRDSTPSGSISPELRLSQLLELESRIVRLESRLVLVGGGNLPPTACSHNHRRAATLAAGDSMRPGDSPRGRGGPSGKRSLLQPPSPGPSISDGPGLQPPSPGPSISPRRLSSASTRVPSTESRESLRPQEKSAFFRPLRPEKGQSTLIGRCASM